MNKMFFAIALIGIVLISGCVNETANTETPQDTSKQVQLTYHSGECTKDTDCLVVYCRDTAEDQQCMNAVQVLTEVKCQNTGGMVSEKSYDVCGCVAGICAGK